MLKIEKETGNKLLSQRHSGKKIRRVQATVSTAEEMFVNKQGKGTFKGFSENHKPSSVKANKLKKLIGKIKGKTALGLAGAGLVGVLGYKLARKLRSDKGRKRK